MRSMRSTAVRLAAVVGAAGVALSATTMGASAAPDSTAQTVAKARAAAAPYLKAPTTIRQDTPLRSRPTPGKNFIFINIGTESAVLVGEGLNEAAGAIGWNYQSISYKFGDNTSLQQAALSALQKDPVAVGFYGATPSVLGASIISAYAQARVPMIFGAECPVPIQPPVFPGSNLCATEVDMGKALANWFIADSKAKGKALVQSLPAFNVLKTFTDAFTAEVRLKCKTCSVETLEVSLAQIGSQQVIPALVNKLRADPSFSYLIFDSANWSRGIEAALNTAGRGNVKVAGRAMDANALAAVKAGTNAAWIAIPYKVAGYALLDSALRVIQKTSGINKNAFTPFQLVTYGNAPSVALPYNAPTNALALYKKLWLVR